MDVDSENMENYESLDADVQHFMAMSRSKLQSAAKKAGIKANRKSIDLARDLARSASSEFLGAKVPCNQLIILFGC